jgi:ribonucleotide reductase beta subunit family protein with ferritin-like domain
MDKMIEIDEYYNKANSSEYEPILDIKKRRYSTFPIEYKNLWDLYKTQQKAFWKAEEIDFSSDYNDFQQLNSDEQYVIKMILAFFANSDGIVNFNISTRLMNTITIMEATVAYNYQMMMENVHSETYSLMLDNLIKDPVEKKYLFDSITTIPSIKNMSDWAFKWIELDSHISKQIVAFACIEGIFFSGAFATIFWLKKYKSSGKLFMTGLVKSNEFISRDEGLHVEFACELYSLLKNKLNKDEFNKIVSESVVIAQDFINDSIKCQLVGLNSNLMNQYIEYVADRLCVSMGYDKIFNQLNPFSFMDTIGMVQKTNFHESRPTEYQSAYNSKFKKLLILNDDEF